MKRKPIAESGVHKYLQSLGLQNATPEVIERAKKAYWNQVKRQWKKDKAKKEKSFSVSFDPSELKDIAEAAAMHNMSRSRFIKLAALSYVHKKYLVPNTEVIHKINFLLSRNYSALQDLYESEKVPPEMAIELMHRMEILEKIIVQHLIQPKLVSSDR